MLSKIRQNGFSILNVLTGILFFYLFAILLFDCEGFLSDIGLETNKSSEVLAKRAAILMLGFSLLTLQAVRIKDRIVRQTISLSAGITFLGLFLMGGYEYKMGNVNSAIIPPMVIEISISLLYLSYWIKYLKKS